jgi:DNA-binding transcriptional regulator YdaS (Cro superfamily)
MAETPQEALENAVSLAGGFTALGRRLGISGEAIMQWDMVPPRRVLEVERVTGVAKERLRPDLYRPTTEAAE